MLWAALAATPPVAAAVILISPGQAEAPSPSDARATAVGQQEAAGKSPRSGETAGPGRGREPNTSAPRPATPTAPEVAPTPVPGQEVTTFAQSDAYLANPGMGYQGWTHAYGALAQSTEYRRGEHPQQGGFDWETLNPAAGQFNWSPIDTFLAECAQRGEQGSFRIFTTNGAPYGTERVPQWVEEQGAVIRETLEPDYRNRLYQQHWGDFVDGLAARYDGDPRIAFIDISGYGLFNEWQANDLTDRADPEGLGVSVDAATRRHLVHMFVGGSGTARVIEADGFTEGVLPYTHTGFARTQLIMPYGGIWATSRWVATNYPHVGFRNDALFGPDAELADFQAMGHGITDIWRTAPVIFEDIGSPPPGSAAAAAETLRGMGASFLHENALDDEGVSLTELVTPLGYRYHPSRAVVPTVVSAGGRLDLETTWTNTGYARAYPRMGQDFALTFGLADSDGTVVTSWQTEHAVSEWLPGEQHVVQDSLPLAQLATGDYTLVIGVVERSTGDRILLPIAGGDRRNWYDVSTVRVTG